MTKASIILLSYQHEEFIAEALVSALEQDYPDVEVIVADDGSTDRTKTIIQEILGTHPLGGRAKILPDAPNLGIVANWNRAVAAASGDILIAIASDDIATRDRVSKAVHVFDTDPQVMAVFSQVSLIDDKGRVFLESVERRRPFYAKYVGSGNVAGIHFWQGAPVLGACGCYRAVLARNFPPLVEALSEDQPYVYRALLLGAVAYVPDRLVFWRWHGANASLGSMNDEETPKDVLRRRAQLFFGRHRTSWQYERDTAVAHAEGLIDEKRYRQELRKIKGHRAIELLGGATICPGVGAGYWMTLAFDVIATNWGQPAAWAFVARQLVKYIAPTDVKLRKSRPIR